jgi:DNA polymerase-3 subunit gamma/tau
MTLLRMLAFKPATAEMGGSAGGGSSKEQVSRKSGAAAPKLVKTQASEPASPKNSWSNPDWSQLVTDLGLTGALRLLASNCALLRREGSTVFLGLDPRSESMLTKQRKDAIAVSLSEHFGEKLAVDISVGAAQEETPVQQESRMADERLEAARLSLEADPNVQTLKNMFGAELKTESIELISGEQE